MLNKFFLFHRIYLALMLQLSSLQKSKIISIISQYQKEFKEKGVAKKRKNPSQFFASKKEMLEHAHYLTDGIKKYVEMRDKKGKVGRHLGSLQTLLWVSGEYTLEELMNHNRPDLL